MDIQRRVSIHLVWGYQKHLNTGLEERAECVQEKPGVPGEAFDCRHHSEEAQGVGAGDRRMKNVAFSLGFLSFKTPLKSHLLLRLGSSPSDWASTLALLFTRCFACHATCLSVRFFS